MALNSPVSKIILEASNISIPILGILQWISNFNSNEFITWKTST